MNTLIILRSLPGAGKSTFADFIANYEEESTVCTADDYFMVDGEYKFDASKLGQAHSNCRIKCEDAMKFEEKLIIVANTNTTEKEMKPYFDLADQYDYHVFSVIIENRHGGKNTHGVPEETIEKMRNRFEVKL